MSPVSSLNQLEHSHCLFPQRVTHYRTAMTIYSVIPTTIRGPWRTTNLKTQFASRRSRNQFKSASDVPILSDLAVSEDIPASGVSALAAFLADLQGSERNNIAASGRTVFIRESVGKCTRQVNTVDAAQNVAAPALRP